MNNHFRDNIKNNRGSSLVMALVVVAFVTIISMAILSLTISINKIIGMEARSKKAFYNADMAMDEIRTGISNNAYAGLGDAYEYVVSNVIQKVGDNLVIINNDEANILLKEVYFHNAAIKVMENAFDNPENAGIYIDDALVAGGNIETIDNNKLAGILKDYLTSEFKDATRGYEVEVKLGTAIPYITVDALNVPDAIVIPDVYVSFTNTETDYFSAISNDIKIVFPIKGKINIIEDSNNILMSFKNYALLSDRVLRFAGSTTVNGGVYGKDKITSYSFAGDPAVGYNSTEDEGAPVISLKISNGNIITPGILSIRNKSVLEFTNGKVWTKNINVEGAEIYFSDTTKTYVADDLTLDVHEFTHYNNKASIRGNYYGYSIEGHDGATDEHYVNPLSVSHSMSSAIIINSKNSVLDLNYINELVLGGYGWVHYNPTDPGAFYRTGESIAVRYAQSVYILPTLWNGVVDENFFGKNLLGSPATIATVIYGDKYTYYFNFSSGDNVAKFYRSLYNDADYYELCNAIPGIDMARADEIRKYYRDIADDAYAAFVAGSDKIRVNNNARVYGKGIIRKNGSGISTFRDMVDASVKKLYMDCTHRNKIVSSLLIELPNDWTYIKSQWDPVTIYPALMYDGYKYSYKIKTEEELTKGAVENIVKGMGRIKGSYYYYVEDENYKNAKDYAVFVANGDVNINSTFDFKKGIIISNGSVNLSTDFEGTILAKNDINVSGGHTYKTNPALIEEIIKTIPGVRGYFDNTSNIEIGKHAVYNDGKASTALPDKTMDAYDMIKSDKCTEVENYIKH